MDIEKILDLLKTMPYDIVENESLIKDVRCAAPLLCLRLMYWVVMSREGVAEEASTAMLNVGVHACLA